MIPKNISSSLNCCLSSANPPLELLLKCCKEAFGPKAILKRIQLVPVVSIVENKIIWYQNMHYLHYIVIAANRNWSTKIVAQSQIANSNQILFLWLQFQHSDRWKYLNLRIFLQCKVLSLLDPLEIYFYENCYESCSVQKVSSNELLSIMLSINTAT